MTNKFIALCLSILMVLGTGVNVFATTTEAVPVSGESAADFDGNGAAGKSAQPNTNSQTATQNATSSDSSSQGTIKNGADGAAVPMVTRTTDNSEAIVEQNRTKNNAMMQNGLYEGMGVSRYSDSRVALAPDITDTKYAEAAKILGALGIMVGDAETPVTIDTRTLHVGSKVRVKGGSLMGLEGHVLQEPDGKTSIVLTIDFLGCAKAEVPLEWLEKV